MASGADRFCLRERRGARRSVRSTAFTSRSSGRGSERAERCDAARHLPIGRAHRYREVIMDRKKPLSTNEAVPTDSGTRRNAELDDATEVDDAMDVDDSVNPNPPRTTTGRMTSPKFGSAGSGGL